MVEPTLPAKAMPGFMHGTSNWRVTYIWPLGHHNLNRTPFNWMNAMTDENRTGSIPATSLNLTEHNLEQLKALFPNVFSEGKVDFAALKAELGEHVETDGERYQFTWAGKEQAKRIATTPSLGTLRPATEESVDWDNTENLYIEGDNLEVLKLLQKSYFNQVKMIYIDPPYNTGKDFVYKDDFKDNLANYQRLTGQRDEEGNPLTTNSDSAGRYHSNWLNMMYPRLKLARNLLRDDGVIFISIDDNEVHNLRKLCDEIFGDVNFVAELLWRRRASSALADNNVSTDHEYVICYQKGMLSGFLGIEKDFKHYSNPDNDSRGDRVAGDLTVGMTASMRPNQSYELIDPNTGIAYPSNPNRVWAYIPESMDKLLQEDRILFPDSPQKRPMLKRFKSELKSQYNPFSSIMLDSVGLNTEATRLMQELFEVSLFEYSKPLSLIESILPQVTQENDLVLDFFSGSSTTAHAVMQLNAEDNGNRKFIMVQIPEPTPEKSEAQKAGYATIAEIGKERIRRAAAKIREEHPDTQADLGFKVLKLDTSNLKKMQPDYTTERRLLDAVTTLPRRSSVDLLYDVLIKYVLPLTLLVAQQQFIVNNVCNVASGSLVACFDENINLDTVQAIIDLGNEDEPILRIVFRDSSFADDIVKTNAIQRFKQAGIDDVLSI